MIKQFFGHLHTINHHKWLVTRDCIRVGLISQGLKHDLSKYAPIEFFAGVKYYEGGKRSPINREKEEKGYSMAWLHHKSRNKHHFWFWVDWNSKQCQYPVRMPLKYVYEMIADTVAAGKVYSKNAGKEWKQSDPYEYYKAHNRDAENGIEFMEFCTKAVLDNIYVDIKEYGLDKVAEMIRCGHYEKFYNNIRTEDGKEILEWLPEYNNLVIKYYMEDTNGN